MKKIEIFYRESRALAKEFEDNYNMVEADQRYDEGTLLEVRGEYQASEMFMELINEFYEENNKEEGL